MKFTQFDRTDLPELIDSHQGPSVSLYMPTHRTGRETRQDPIRFKNLVKQAASQLSEVGCSEQQVDDLLAPVSEIPADVTDPVWQNGNDGLVVLLSENDVHGFKLPMDMPELVVVDDQFYVGPLLQYVQGSGRFYLLAASQNAVRLFHGSKHAFSEDDVESLPNNLQDALNIDEYQASLQYHAHLGGAHRNDEAMFHGHGGGEGEDRKAEILEYFHRLDRVLTPYLTPTKAPLVFAGVEYLFPIFKQACHYRRLVDQPVTGNPDDASPEELHASAWTAVESRFLTERDEALERFHYASSRGRATEDLAQIVSFAYQGRVESLFACDSLEKEVKAKDASRGHRHIEKLQSYSRAALQTLRSDGSVFVVPDDAIPGNSPVAAILRW